MQMFARRKTDRDYLGRPDPKSRAPSSPIFGEDPTEWRLSPSVCVFGFGPQKVLKFDAQGNRKSAGH